MTPRIWKCLRAAALLTAFALVASCGDAGSSGGTVLAHGYSVTGLAVDPTHVYWTDFAPGTVSKAPKVGGAPVQLVSGQSSDPLDLVVRDGWVYWVGANSATVNKVAAAGGTPVTIARGGLVGWRGLAVDATHAYWMASSGGGAVMRVPTGGGVPAETVHSGTFYPKQLAADDATIFATVLDDYGTGVGRVVAIPKAGGAAVTLASGQLCPTSVAVDATDVYWTNAGAVCDTTQPMVSDAVVMKVAKTGGTPVVIATGQAAPRGLALDAVAVYWTQMGTGASTGTVNRAPKDGASAWSVIASGQPSVGRIAVDATSVYWVANGAILRAPKR